MEMKNIRKANLRRWFASRPIPEQEKSYLSQLQTGKASFGEKAARRLEGTYGMPVGYLDKEPAEQELPGSNSPRELSQSFICTMAWPFATLTPEQWLSIPMEIRATLETHIRSLVPERTKQKRQVQAQSESMTN